MGENNFKASTSGLDKFKLWHNIMEKFVVKGDQWILIKDRTLQLANT